MHLHIIVFKAFDGFYIQWNEYLVLRRTSTLTLHFIKNIIGEICYRVAKNRDRDYAKIS